MRDARIIAGMFIMRFIGLAELAGALGLILPSARG